MLQTDSLSKTYRGRRGRKVHAVRNLDLKIDQGTVFGFIGPNGSGKSTTIKMLMNFLKPSGGSAEINGIPVSDPACRKSVGYLPENPRYYSYLTPLEYLAMIAALKGMPGSRGKASSVALLHQFELEYAAKRTLRTFSKGMIQRVGFAAALVGEPDILILDEPMSGLDPVGRELFQGIMMDLKNRGKTLFFSSHILHDVETLCDKIGIIVNGRLRYSGSVDVVLENSFRDYVLKLDGVPDEDLAQAPFDSLEYVREHDGILTVFVPKEDLNSYLSMFIRENYALSAFEPRRKSLQRFFMDMLGQDKQREVPGLSTPS